MFTGIIESIGKVTELKLTSSASAVGTSYSLKIETKFLDEQNDPIALGESIAVNGVCLTVAELPGKSVKGDVKVYRFDLAPETVERTALGKLTPSRKVNLERSLKMGSRLSGHWVQGHVDGVAVLSKILEVPGNCFELTFEIQDPKLTKYCVKKGSISVNGISLTIHEIQQNQLKFQIIPHTWKETNLSDLLPGEMVNIEVDILAKYAENFSTRKP